MERMHLLESELHHLKHADLVEKMGIFVVVRSDLAGKSVNSDHYVVHFAVFCHYADHPLYHYAHRLLCHYARHNVERKRPNL